MLEIRINKHSGKSYITNFNGDILETALHFFPFKFVESIDILSGGIHENEYNTYTPLQIFRANPEDIEKHELFHNVRIMYKLDYKNPFPDGTTQIINSCGLCRI